MLTCFRSNTVKQESQIADASRRNFLRRVALGGLTALTATLVARGKSQACVNEGLCPGCPAYDDCNLPRALSRKQSNTAGAFIKP
jgi:hypothetical protein